VSNVPTNLIPSTITQLPEYQGSSTLGYFAYSLEGRSYKVQFANLASVGAVPSTRVIAAGTGLTGGGDLSQDRVISIANGGVGTAQLADSGVIAGSYGSGTDVPVLTVDAKGRITAASTTPLSISGYVPTSRTITTGAGLLGGGSLASNLTLTVDFSSATPQALGSATAGVSTAAARGDHVHPAVDLSDTDQTQGALPLGRGGTGDALSPVAGAVVYSTGTKFALADPGLPGQVLTSDGAGEPYWQTIAGTGTVTSVSVVTANGFAGTVANANTTPAITVSTTVTGLVKGNGTALSAAVAGTDYVAPGVITGSGLTMATSRLLGRTTASSGAVEEITVGTGLSLSGGSLVNSAPDQVVSFTSGTGISVSGTYPAFTITNTAPDQVVSLTAGSGISITGSYPSFTIAATGGSTGTVTSVDVSGSTTGLTFTGGPITTSGTITMGGTLVVANGGTGATTAAGARTNLGAAASGANSDITSLSGITGGIATPDYIDFDTTAAPARATGRMWWDNADGIQTLNLGMAGSNATLQIGEEMYFRVKASSAITEGQVVMFTGTVGASGALTGAPATGLTKDTASYIMGVATEDIALNGWGYVTQFGLVRGINTTGGAEAWVDGQILYYDPSVAGGLTKTVPTAPAAKVEVAAVINAASNGSLFIRPIARFSLGQLNDVETAAAANNDLLQYSSSGGYWQHVSPSTISVGTATNLAGGAANRIAYQTGSGTTGFITAPSVANTFLEWSGSAFQWSSNPLGTVTSVDVSGGTTGLTTSGGPVTTSGTITLGGTLAASNGGTGLTSPGTSGNVLTSNGSAWVSSPPAAGGITYTTVKTSNFTASPNDGVQTNTSGGSFTVTLPATPAVGDQVIIVDSANSWATNNLTVGRNGSTINDLASDLTCDISGVSVQFVYSGTTWDVYAQVGGAGAGLISVAGGGTGASSLTSGYLLKGNGTSPVTASVVYDDGTNVGIGDPAPAYKLTIAGDMRVTGGGDIRISSATGTTTAGGDSQIYNDANNMIFTTGTTTTQRMQITSVGKLLLGTTAAIDGAAFQIDAANAGDAVYVTRFDNTSTSTSAYNVSRWLQGASGSSVGYIGTGGSAVAQTFFRNRFVVGTQNNTDLCLATNDTFRGLISGDGQFRWGDTATIDTVSYAPFQITNALAINTNTTAGTTAVSFFNGQGSGTRVGYIGTSGSSTSYNTSSDARLKENIADAADAGAIIDGMRVRQFDWKINGEHQRYGMIAQELDLVFPEAVAHGPTEEDTLAVDYSKLVPMLVKEIQSLRARVAQLEGK